jgi:cGMP-dependent protein kinase
VHENTVTARTTGKLWAIDRFSFRRILRKEGEQIMKERLQFLESVELLAPLSTSERMKIAEALEVCDFKADDVICNIGDPGDCMYFVKDGHIAIYKPEGMETTPVGGAEEQKPTSGKEVLVAECKSGDYFGERSLLTGDPRAAKVTTTTVVKALKLDRTAFTLLLGPLEHILQSRVASYAEARTSVSTGSATTGTRASIEDEEPGEAAPNIEMSDLRVVGILGTGSFGHVQLMQHVNTGTTYALKRVNKQHVVNTNQQKHVIDEKKAMCAIKHPFTVSLIQTYKDQNCIYWLMEPVMGGEMFGYLQTVNKLGESSSKFYIGQVILAFEHIHSKGYVYRDLKPENILFDNEGYIKITDFGFAKIVSGRTFTMCGTPDYLAPEIIEGKGHDFGVD